MVDGHFQIQSVDNGRSMNADGPTEGGRGLVNLRRRAETLHGRIDIEHRSTGRTVLTWSVQLRNASALDGDTIWSPNEIVASRE